MNSDGILDRLSQSEFRASFKLKSKDKEYVYAKGLDEIRKHAMDFVISRLSDTSRVTDGKQTPTKGHPVFIAQHATATCCRKCLFKWHKIGMDRLLTDQEIDFVVNLIMDWIARQLAQE